MMEIMMLFSDSFFFTENKRHRNEYVEYGFYFFRRKFQYIISLLLPA